jgi:hypothetical protein
VSVAERRAAKLVRIKERLTLYRDSHDALLTGRVQSYNIGSRALTYIDIPWLAKQIDELEDQLDLLENPGGRFRYVVPKFH